MRTAVVVVAAAAVVAGCGGDDFENKPRPPVTLELTGVIKADAVTIEPSKVGAGPVRITVSNQTEEPHTLTLEGQGTGTATKRRQVGPINPLDTATIQADLAPGKYTVTAGSEKAAAKGAEIEPASLVIGNKRKSGSDELLLP
jgi:hypothetical protein